MIMDLKYLIISLIIHSLVILVKGQEPDIETKIVGGRDVEISTYPWQVSVRLMDHHICGGAIINRNTILTAAHCVHDQDHSQYSVRVGHTRHSSGTSFKVASIKENRGYDTTTFENDMAILKLRKNLTYGKNIKAIDLQQFKRGVTRGTRAWVSGWGVTSEGDPTVQHRLRATDVKVISNEECNRKYGPGRISSKMLCAQTLHHDSCQGDSGGPLVADGKLIGVVSWGFGCARPEYPGVYANVSEMYGWILSNM